MRRVVVTDEPDLKSFAGDSATHGRDEYVPQVLSVADLLALDVPAPAMLIEGLLPTRGACLTVGFSKSGKSVLATQVAIAVASGKPLFDFYRILEPGPALLLEQDDPGASASVKDILQHSPIAVDGIPFYLTPKVPFPFDERLFSWLEAQICSLSLRLVVLDSYTCLRGSRPSGVDIVKLEHSDMTMLDELAKRTGCTILVIHHGSKGSIGKDWSVQAAGTFAMSAAVEALVHVSRFDDLESNAPERLVRVRGRHIEGTEMVTRFLKPTLNYEHILEGAASVHYPVLLQIKSKFGTSTFGPKELSHETGLSRATANRQIERLYRGGALAKRGFGEYAVALRDL